MAAPNGYVMHDSGFWYKLSDQSGPYVFNGSGMTLVGGANAVRTGIACSKAGVMGGLSAVGGANSGLSDAVGTSATNYLSYRIPRNSAIADVQVEFWNGHITSAGEAPGLNPIGLNGSLQYNGTLYQLMVSGVPLSSTILQPGAKVLCDPVTIALAQAGTFGIKSFVSVVSAGQTWPVGRKPGAGEGTNGGYSGLTGADTSQVLGTAGLSTAPNGIFGPSLIIATVRQGGVLVVGDSKAAGVGELGPDAFGQIGFIERTFGNEFPWFTNTRSGTKLADFNANHSAGFTSNVRYCSSVLFQRITNDIWTDGANLAQMQARCQAAWAEATSRGRPAIQMTCGPSTTGTWDTLAGQTIADPVKEANRVAVNDWLRTVPDGVNAVIDTADVEESSRNSGKWRVDLGGPATGDGLHDGPLATVKLIELLQTKLSLFM